MAHRIWISQIVISRYLALYSSNRFISYCLEVLFWNIKFVLLLTNCVSDCFGYIVYICINQIQFVMREKRLFRAHELLLRIEELRFRVVTLANIYNQHVTESYEKELYDELEDVDGFIRECLKRCGVTDPCPRNDV